MPIDWESRHLGGSPVPAPNLKLTARKGNNRKENNNMRKHTWKAVVSAAAIAVGAAIPMAANAAYTRVTQTIDGIEWQLQQFFIMLYESLGK